MPNLLLKMPEQVNMILEELESAGYEAYAVGGCIRDSLMGKQPRDWDIGTAARPDDVKRVFHRLKTSDVGIGHGTVGLTVGGKTYEVTTFRSDGKYSDSRHPDKVTFSETIEQDLARRDFTMNAMAYGKKCGLIDLFGGYKDIENGIIRVVGNPEQRFSEDALRIFRALRFAAESGFSIENATESSIYDLYLRTKVVAYERLNAEFAKIILGNFGEKVIKRYKKIFEEVFDIKLPKKIEFDYLPKDKALRLATLLTDEYGTGVAAYASGGGLTSKILAFTDLKRMRFDNKTVREVRDIHDASSELLFYKKCSYPCRSTHKACASPDVIIRSKKIQLKKMLAKYGESCVGKALILNRESRCTLDEIIRDGDCYSLKQLDVTGHEIRNLVSCTLTDNGGQEKSARSCGRLTGKLLDELLDAVIEEKIPNRSEELLKYAQKSLQLKCLQ